MRKRLAVAILVLVTTTPAFAGESPHHAAMFGGTSVADGHVAPAAGLEYEYRFGYAHGLFGAGPLVEAAFAEHVESLALCGAYVHPVAGLKAFVLPGVEVAEGHSAFLIRGGIGYDFHIGDFSLSPVANIDYVNHHVIQVYGLTFGMGFGGPSEH